MLFTSEARVSNPACQYGITFFQLRVICKTFIVSNRLVLHGSARHFIEHLDITMVEPVFHSAAGFVIEYSYRRGLWEWLLD